MKEVSEILLYKVLDTFPVGKNTSVTIEGNGSGLKNNMIISDENGNHYKLISVALLSGQSPDQTGKTTTFLIEGNFKSETIKL